MLRKIINELEAFNNQEKQLLIDFVEDVYFYWDKFEILSDAIDIIHNFYKPKPISYYSPLSEFQRIDRVFNYNAYVVAFINSTSFFESVMKRADDRFLIAFIKRSKANVKILYQLKVELYKINNLQISYDLESFIKLLDDLERKLINEVEKDYVKEIKKYRDKVLSHHTFFNGSDIEESVSDSLMNAKKFLDSIIQNQLGEIITQKYNPRQQSILNDIDSLRKITKPNLQHIIQGRIIFPLVDKERLKLAVEDDLFVSMIKNFSAYNVNQDRTGAMVVDYEIRKSFYERNANKGIDTKIKIYNEHRASTSNFMELVHKFTRIDELTHEVVREFIEKVIIHKAEKVSGRRQIKIDIFYNGIGKVDIPN